MNRRELVSVIFQELEIMDNKSLSRDTHEWYLHNHLEYLINVTKKDNNSNELLDAGNKFIMFCTDSMNWDTAEYKKLVKFGQMAIKIAKAERNK